MRMEVLNPVARVVQQKGASAQRLGTLQGKRVGLYWNQKPGGDAALARAAELLRSRYPHLEFGNYAGSIGGVNRYLTSDDVLRISRECSAVIGSTGD